MASSIKTVSWGGNDGEIFEKRLIKKISLHTSTCVNQIGINKDKHGSGGVDRGEIILAPDEHINKVNIRSSVGIDFAEFTTNKARTISGGAPEGSNHILENMRVIAIGGRSSLRLDKLDIMYIDKYEESTIEERNVEFILSYTLPFKNIYMFEKTREQVAEIYRKMTKIMLERQYSASIEGEYYEKVIASTKLEVKDVKLETVKNELEKDLITGSPTVRIVPKDHVGIEVISGTIMKGADGNFWVSPIDSLSYSAIQINDAGSILNHYDLTGTLHTQIPSLALHKTTKNNYIYYSEQNNE